MTPEVREAMEWANDEHRGWSGGQDYFPVTENALQILSAEARRLQAALEAADKVVFAIRAASMLAAHVNPSAAKSLMKNIFDAADKHMSPSPEAKGGEKTQEGEING